MTDCIIKAFGGCACKPGECAEKPATVPPVILISARTQMAVCLFVGVIAAFLAAAVMETKLRTSDLINQEVTRHVSR